MLKEIRIKGLLQEKNKTFKGYLIEGTSFAVENNGEFVWILGVSETDVPGVYRMTGRDGVNIAIDVPASTKKTEELIRQLKSMSAFSLLTEHFVSPDDGFNITRQYPFGRWG